MRINCPDYWDSVRTYMFENHTTNKQKKRSAFY